MTSRSPPPLTARQEQKLAEIRRAFSGRIVVFQRGTFTAEVQPSPEEQQRRELEVSKKLRGTLEESLESAKKMKDPSQIKDLLIKLTPTINQLVELDQVANFPDEMKTYDPLFNSWNRWTKEVQQEKAEQIQNAIAALDQQNRRLANPEKDWPLRASFADLAGDAPTTEESHGSPNTRQSQSPDLSQRAHQSGKKCKNDFSDALDLRTDFRKNQPFSNRKDKRKRQHPWTEETADNDEVPIDKGTQQGATLSKRKRGDSPRKYPRPSRKDKLLRMARKREDEDNLAKPRRCHHCRTMQTGAISCQHVFVNGIRCRKKYCLNCLSTIYPREFQKKKKAEWTCPSCLGFCLCARCTSSEQMDSKKQAK